jgi:hypothetical protein
MTHLHEDAANPPGSMRGAADCKWTELFQINRIGPLAVTPLLGAPPERRIQQNAANGMVRKLVFKLIFSAH